MMAKEQVVIVGAGPAGIRAAEVLVSAGIRPLVIDEGMSWGGQIYRQPPSNAGFVRTKKDLYGFEAGKADAVHSTMAGLLPKLEYRSETLAWACGANHIDTLRHGRQGRVPFSHLIIASGATDRVLPVPGWTLPGVYTLGGAQVALKAQGCSIGRRVVLAGTGPLLYLVAYQYVKAGAQVVAVLDTNGLGRQVRATPKLASQPGTLVKGAYYVGWLMSRGVKVMRNASVVAIDGDQAVTGIRWKRNHQPGQIENLACDAVGFGFGLRPETQLADLAGCQFEFNELNRCWLPKVDSAGRSSVPGIYLAGDGAGIAGADAAELTGRRAGLAVLDDLEIEHPASAGAPSAATIRHKLERIARFRSGIESAFAVPADPAASWPDDLTVCRCEDVKVGTLRKCIRQGQATEVNRLKALTRVGMGRCQGRMCGESAITLLASELGRPLRDVGRLRSQPPVKPISIQPDLEFDECKAAAGEVDDE